MFDPKDRRIQLTRDFLTVSLIQKIRERRLCGFLESKKRESPLQLVQNFGVRLPSFGDFVLRKCESVLDFAVSGRKRAISAGQESRTRNKPDQLDQMQLLEMEVKVSVVVEKLGMELIDEAN